MQRGSRRELVLREIGPPIRRRVQVPGDITLAKLHRVLQIAMGWTNSHLHKFTIGGVDYAEPDPDGLLEFRSACRTFTDVSHASGSE